MSPRDDNREPNAKPDVTVEIPHYNLETPPASAPPLLPLESLPEQPSPAPQEPKSTPTPPLPPLPPIPPIEEFHERRERHWVAVLIYVGLALLVAILIVLGGRWIYQKTTNNKPASPTPAPADTNKLPPQPGASSQNSGPNTNEPSTNTSQTVATNGQLPNNGPGDVIAIFVGTVVVAGGLHFLYNLRKQT